MNLLSVAPEQLDGIGAALSQEDLKSMMTQNGLQEGPEVGLLIDNQDAGGLDPP